MATKCQSGLPSLCRIAEPLNCALVIAVNHWATMRAGIVFATPQFMCPGIERAKLRKKNYKRWHRQTLGALEANAARAGWACWPHISELMQKLISQVKRAMSNKAPKLVYCLALLMLVLVVASSADHAMTRRCGLCAHYFSYWATHIHTYI